MLGAKRGESLRSREAIDSAIVQQGSSDRAVGGSVTRWLDAFRCCPNIDTRDESITDFNRLTESISLVDSVAYALMPFVWSEFDLWHAVCTCLL